MLKSGSILAIAASALPYLSMVIRYREIEGFGFSESRFTDRNLSTVCSNVKCVYLGCRPKTELPVVELRHHNCQQARQQNTQQLGHLDIYPKGV